MAKSDAGRQLTPDEVREYVAYQNAGLAQPDKFAGIVFENTASSGATYRFATDDERKAEDAAVIEAEARAKAEADLSAKIQAEAAKRQTVDDATPPAPPAPPKAS